MPQLPRVPSLTVRLSAGLLALAAVLASPVPVYAKGCAEGSPAVKVPSSLWGELKPGEVLLDGTGWTGSQLPNSRFPVSTGVDVENGFLFSSYYAGFMVWDTRQTPGAPTRLFLADGFAGAFPKWTAGAITEFTQIVYGIDAPPDTDNIFAVAAIPPAGLSIWDASNKALVRPLYQDYGAKFMYHVHAAKIGNREYAFGADFAGDPGLHVYDMTAARGFATACLENRTMGEGSCPNVYVGRVGAKETTKYVHGLAVGSRYFVVKSGASGGLGTEIWDVSNPAAPSLVVRGLQSGGGVHGVGLWTHSSRHYLGLRQNDTAKIVDVTSCLNSGCQSLPDPIWTRNLEPVPEAVHWLTVSFSRSGSVPFLYFGNGDSCRQGDAAGRTEYLFDVSNAAAPRDITPNGTVQDQGVNVDYWSWYYSDFARGFSHFSPRAGKFNGEYFYRAGGTILDVHQWMGGGGPPIANFVYSPTEIYPGDLVTFTDTSIGNVASRSWTFPDGSPAGGTTSPVGVTFAGTGTKAVSLNVSNANGPGAKTQNVVVLDPAPAVAAAGASPGSPLVCQPVTLTATGVTGKAPLGLSWVVKTGGGTTVATGSTNPFVWQTAGNPAGPYSATFTASNGAGNASKVVGVTLAALPALPANLTFAPTNDAFVAGTVQFHVAAPGGTEWSWDFGDGQGFRPFTSDPIAGPNPAHSYTSTGPKTVRVKVRNCLDLNGVQSADLAINITQVSPLEITEFRANCQLFCDFEPNTAITFNQAVTGGPDSYEYDWNGDGTYEETSATPVTSHTYAQNGTFLPAMRLKRGSETTAAYPHFAPINIRNLGGGGGGGSGGSTPAITIAGAVTGRPNEAINYTANASNCTGGGAWTWSAQPDGAVTPSGSQASITWPTLGTKTVRATNSGCGSAQGTRTVTIVDPPGSVRADFLFAPDQPLAGQAVSFNASASSGSPGIYFWEFGDGATGDGVQVSHVFGAGGAYNVRLTVAKDCVAGVCAAQHTLSKIVPVASGPTLVASFVTSATCSADLTGERCEVKVGEEATFTSTSTGGPSTFQWSFNDGGTASGPQVSHKWSAPGAYFVQLTIGNGQVTANTARLFVVTGQPVPKNRAVVLPWIAQTRGALVQSSDLYLHNPGDVEMKVVATFLRRGMPETNPPTAALTIAPHATLFYGDVIKDLFKKENTAGFIMVDPEGDGALPVITSFNSTLQTDGSKFGQTVPGSTLSSSTAASTLGDRKHHLVGLNANSEKLAYLGVSNPNLETANYKLAFFDRLGRKVAETEPIVLPSFGQQQWQAKQLAANWGINNLDDYRVEVQSVVGGELFPYGANLRTSTVDPSFVGGGRSTDALVHLVGVFGTAGLNNTRWQTDVLLANSSDQVVLTDVSFRSVGVAPPTYDTVRVTLQPRETKRIENVLQALWGLSSAVGVLSFDSDSPNGVYPTIVGEVYDNANPRRRFGQAMTARALDKAATAGQSQHLVGLRQDAEYRTTLSLFNPGTAPAAYDLIYRGLGGNVIQTIANLSLAPGRSRQVNPSQHPLPAAGVVNGFSIEVKVKAGQLFIGGQVVINRTNDPAFIDGETR
ncbi:MAG TPA: PKD domain-containing protein [Thermoanaerobaculia bacterium]|nr:PKD domain-containing protein [Thermoanaerobaculia bacterium]